MPMFRKGHGSRPILNSIPPPFDSRPWADASGVGTDNPETSPRSLSTFTHPSSELPNGSRLHLFATAKNGQRAKRTTSAQGVGDKFAPGQTSQAVVVNVVGKSRRGHPVKTIQDQPKPPLECESAQIGKATGTDSQ